MLFFGHYVVLFCLVGGSLGLDNGVGLTPPMGYNTCVGNMRTPTVSTEDGYNPSQQSNGCPSVTHAHARTRTPRWDDFRCGGVNESNIHKVANAFIKYGLDKVGYQCVHFGS